MLTFLHGCWYGLDVMQDECSMMSTTKSSPVWLSVVLRGMERRENRPFRVLGAGLRILSSLPPCLESVTTEVAETLPGNWGQRLDTYSSSALVASVSAHSLLFPVPFVLFIFGHGSLSIYWILSGLAGHYHTTALKCFQSQTEYPKGGQCCICVYVCQVRHLRRYWFVCNGYFDLQWGNFVILSLT